MGNEREAWLVWINPEDGQEYNEGHGYESEVTKWYEDLPEEQKKQYYISYNPN